MSDVQQVRTYKGIWDYLMLQLREINKYGPDNSNHYLRLRDLLGRNSKILLYDDSPEERVNLVHYTTWNSALKIFGEKDISDDTQRYPALRMHNYEQSNDPKEGRIKPPEWEEVEEGVLGWIDTILKDGRQEIEGMDTYGCSFSSGPSGVEDDLTYWRLYGNDGKGCSLKISGTHGEKMYKVYKVRYRNENFNEREDKDREEDEETARRLKKLFEIVKKIEKGAPDECKHIVRKTVAEGLLRIIYGYYHLIKHIAYAGEKEWRMIRVMPGPDEIQFYTTSKNVIKRYVDGPPLKELLISESIITIGPTVPNPGAARAYFEHLSKKIHKINLHEIGPVKVKNSNKTYRRV